jgi:hypothetical protein
MGSIHILRLMIYTAFRAIPILCPYFSKVVGYWYLPSKVMDDLIRLSHETEMVLEWYGNWRSNNYLKALSSEFLVLK